MPYSEPMDLKTGSFMLRMRRNKNPLKQHFENMTFKIHHGTLHELFLLSQQKCKHSLPHIQLVTFFFLNKSETEQTPYLQSDCCRNHIIHRYIFLQPGSLLYIISILLITYFTRTHVLYTGVYPGVCDANMLTC